MCWQEHKEIGVYDLCGERESFLGSVAKERDGWAMYVNGRIKDVRLPGLEQDLKEAKKKVMLKLRLSPTLIRELIA